MEDTIASVSMTAVTSIHNGHQLGMPFRKDLIAITTCILVIRANLHYFSGTSSLSACVTTHIATVKEDVDGTLVRLHFVHEPVGVCA